MLVRDISGMSAPEPSWLGLMGTAPARFDCLQFRAPSHEASAKQQAEAQLSENPRRTSANKPLHG
jgi:hypothetical protein